MDLIVETGVMLSGHLFLTVIRRVAVAMLVTELLCEVSSLEFHLF